MVGTAAERLEGRMAERDFDEFYASNYGRLVVQVFAITGKLADAEDAVQEAFARASVRWGAGRRLRLARGVGPPGGAQPGLHGAAAGAPTAGGPEPGAGTAAGGAVAGRQPGAGGGAEGLAAGFRQVLVLHYLADLPVERVAGQLGIAVGTAKSRLARAREALARQLVDGEEEVASGRR
jgi:RNA polymerase sigma-70 factor (ECF subfamily)